MQGTWRRRNWSSRSKETKTVNLSLWDKNTFLQEKWSNVNQSFRFWPSIFSLVFPFHVCFQGSSADGSASLTSDKNDLESLCAFRTCPLSWLKRSQCHYLRVCVCVRVCEVNNSHSQSGRAAQWLQGNSLVRIYCVQEKSGEGRCCKIMQQYVRLYWPQQRSF